MSQPVSAALALAAALLCAPAPAGAPGSIEGTVRQRSGAPLANARVFVLGQPHSALSDSTGWYRLPTVPAGSHRLRAMAAGYREVERTVAVRPGETVRVEFLLDHAPKEMEEISAAAAGDEVDARRRLAIQAFAPRSAGLHRPDWNTENYAVIEESRFLAAADNPRSTFSIDVDAASYTNVRRFLTQGRRPPRDAVRVEEFLNYFRYDYPQPRGSAPFSVTTDLAVAPWAPEHRLLRIGIKGKSLRAEAVPPSNLVFLLDVSGSMQPPDKLPLVKQAFRLLVQELRPQDRVAIVVYAGAAGLVLPSTPGSDKATILAALDRLEAGGSTAGGAGLRLAYEVARQHYAREGNNRVILASDGDFNVGESSDAAMVRLIEEHRDQGIFLTVLGFGTGNLKDSRMEQIADRGNGHYAYVDNLNEARRVFVREFAGTLVTIARDVKIQVEFNPARVDAYRLVGYENRALRNEDFADDRKDAGELGAGHTVTALYEILPTGASAAAAGRDLDSLKYQSTRLRPDASGSDEWLTVQLRYKEPTGAASRLLTHPVRSRGELGEPTGDFRFASAVAAFGMVLRESEYRGTATLDQVLALARGSEGEDRDGERAEFVRLVESARLVGLARTGGEDG